MNDIEIKTHDFENAKKQIKTFSEEIPSEVELPVVATRGGLLELVTDGPGTLLDKNVKGRELNDLTEKIQERFINTNKTLVKCVKEFDEVYKAFEALDKDYIQGIMAAVKAAEKASEQAKTTAKEAQKNTLDIKELIEAQQLIIEKLVAFKERVENNEKNIDTVVEAAEKVETICEQNRKLQKKITLAYILSGGFGGIALAHIILNFLGVI